MGFAATLALSWLLQQDPAPSQTQERPVLKLTLRQCIHLALSHNVDLEIARYEPRIEDARIVAAEGGFDHVAYSSVAGGESVTRTSNPLDPTDIDTDTATSRTGLKRLLPFGLSYDVYFEVDRTLSNAFFSQSLNPRWTQALGVELVLPLLKGRGAEAQYSSVIVAQRSREAAVFRFEKSLVDQVAAVEQAYWDLVFALETLEVNKQSVKTAERLLEENREKFRMQLLARVDVTEAEAGVAAKEEGILLAESAVQTAMDNLKRLINPELLRGEISIAPQDAPQPFERPLDDAVALEEALSKAFAQRPEYRELKPLLLAQEQTLRKVENDRLPQLDLTASGSLLGLEDRFSEANDELRSLDFHDFTVGAVFELPLEGRAARGQALQAELERRQLELQRRSLEDQILMEVRAAIRDLKTTEKRIEASKRARQLAQERFDGEMSRRQAGLRTTFHVLDAEERLVQARTNEIKALIDYNLAQMSLRRASGGLLEWRGVLVQENLGPRLER